MVIGETIDWWSVIARRKLELPLEWRWSKLENVGRDAVIVTGGIPRRLTRGKNKGGVTWRGVPSQQCVVTRAELNEECLAYEAKTGFCHACFGKGQEPARWSKTEGTTYRDCGRCKGTGKAPVST